MDIDLAAGIWNTFVVLFATVNIMHTTVISLCSSWSRFYDSTTHMRQVTGVPEKMSPNPHTLVMNPNPNTRTRVSEA